MYEQLEQRLRYITADYKIHYEAANKHSLQSIALNFSRAGYDGEIEVYNTQISNNPFDEFMKTLRDNVLEQRKDSFLWIKKDFFKPEISRNLLTAPWIISYWVRWHTGEGEVDASANEYCIIPHKLINIGDPHFNEDIFLVPDKEGKYYCEDSSKKRSELSEIADNSFFIRAYELDRDLDKVHRRSLMKRPEAIIVRAEY